LVGFEHQQSKYFYVRDLLGVIRNIIDINGNIVVTYKYDAWGNHKVYDSSNAENTSTSFIGNINPFRYKGYYYDLETEWYYLQSRYYSPLLSRFINMDHTANLGMIDVDGVFLFAYCGNNPIDRFDYDGKSWKKFFNKTKKWIKGIANSIGELFTEIVETVSEVVGGQINVGKEIVTSFQYFWLFTIETGTGYAKSFDNSKPVNFFVNIPNQFWKFWEYSVGIDVNINGWGAGINIGGESSFNLHLGKHNIDIFSNSIGRYGFKISSQGDNGEYSYYKFSINMPEVLVTVAVLYFGWQFIAALLLAWGASGAPVPNF
jgi:RHS repeat-associated protein